MDQEHVISEELMRFFEGELARNNHWLTYNQIPYFLDKGDAWFFKNKDEADEFAANNISEYDCYEVIYATSVADLLRQISYGELLNEQINLTNKKIFIMNEQNLDYLKNQLKFTGFGESLEKELKEKMQTQEPQFTIFHQASFGKDSTIATLQFQKSKETDMYFFNRYSLALKNDQHPDAIKQTFYIASKEDNVTLKEAYNLMSGRAVNKDLSTKEGEKYNAWVQLDFKEMDKNGNYKVKQYHENYGYDIAATLAKHPVKELSVEQDKTRLLESLQRGNRQSVTLVKDGEEQKVFIEAAPQFKSLNFYDSNMQRLKLDNLYEKKTTEQSVKKDSKQSQKEVKGEKIANQNMKKTRNKKQGVKV